MDKTQEPVVFLDVDLEFHTFPELFLDDAWPDGPRDVALFNFWANETNMTYRHTPNIGSAVAYFNQTYRAKKLLTAWAEAMQYSTNSRAPDDQARHPPARCDLAPPPRPNDALSPPGPHLAPSLSPPCDSAERV